MHHLEGNAISAGYSHAHMLNVYVIGVLKKLLNTISIVTICGRFFTFWKIFTANLLKFLYYHQEQELGNG